MKTTIQDKLKEIEKEHDIRILYACESGSRGWGFASPDSDYDVRFIYTRSLDKYLTIQPPKDHLSFPINDELDIYGWDISKVLKLIARSNTTPFEWLQSPIIYQEEELFRKELWELCQNYFCARSNTHHYMGIARSALETMEDGEIKIKKLFYVLRPLLSALWCIEKGTIAPMNIEPLMELLSTDLQKKVISLIELKSGAAEGFIIEIDDTIKIWIDENFDYCIKKAKMLDKQDFEIGLANNFFLKTIKND